jgi:aspartyl-tRNA(Asn)/glutamyl-tRNA(Gln) amidotransferase subunit A
VPGVSLPCGKSKAGLPVGLQLMARHFDEARLLQLAHAFEMSGGFEI